MADEEKKNDAEVKEEKTAEAPAAPEAAAPAQAEAAQPVSGDVKKVKVTSMTLDQVNKALKRAEEIMGGYNSHYAQALLARKKVLSNG